VWVRKLVRMAGVVLDALEAVPHHGGEVAEAVVDV
jgi:hypothetical protein